MITTTVRNTRNDDEREGSSSSYCKSHVTTIRRSVDNTSGPSRHLRAQQKGPCNNIQGNLLNPKCAFPRGGRGPPGQPTANVVSACGAQVPLQKHEYRIKKCVFRRGARGFVKTWFGGPKMCVSSRREGAPRAARPPEGAARWSSRL